MKKAWRRHAHSECARFAACLRSKQGERSDQRVIPGQEEILNIPEGIPKALLDKAECVVIYPSVKKAAFIVGGSYGRGVIPCRTGEEFNRPWSAPAMVKLGADASAAAGPKGRSISAETDIVMKAEILSYSRAQRRFAGVSLERSTLRSDDGANKALYGKELWAREIVRGGRVHVPASAHKLLLDRVSPRHGTEAKEKK
jgi:lipid-binding SYLF domain-containing protein